MYTEPVYSIQNLVIAMGTTCMYTEPVYSIQNLVIPSGATCLSADCCLGELAL